MQNNYELSICITTLDRCEHLKVTIDSIIAQKKNDLIELIIQNGGCSDDTDQMMLKYSSEYDFISYINPNRKMGLDEGYHQALQKASGKYCWCIPDDDLIKEGGLTKIIDLLKEDPDLLIVNLRCYTKDLKFDLKQNLIPLKGKKIMNYNEFDKAFSSCISSLSYTGTIILPREIWFESDLSNYYESWFGTYAAMASSSRIKKIIYLDDPIILYRSACSTWTDHSFEIWYEMWPKIVNKFNLFSEARKINTDISKPWLRVLTLLKSRAFGEYRIKSYFKYIYKDNDVNFFNKVTSLLICFIPITILNLSVLVTMLIFKRKQDYSIYTMAMASSFPNFAIIVCKIFKKFF